MKTENDFVKEMDIKKVNKYKKPMMILMSGLPGSGKSSFARQTSNELGIYLISNDYVRNYYYQFLEDETEEVRQEIQSKVFNINNKRIAKLLLSRTSFILDADVNSFKMINKYKTITKLLNYKLVKIRLYSNDDQDNIKRISNKKQDFNYVYDGVIGDNVSYSRPYPEPTYYEIKARKPNNIPDIEYDYIIENKGTIEEFKSNTDKVLQKIKYYKK